jgi:sugar lactone lactonase YvrE
MSRPFRAGPLPSLEGPLAPNRALERCERISVGEILHSDKLLVSADGAVYAGDESGAIFRLVPNREDGYTLERFAQMGGRPMELAPGPDGQLIVGDHEGPHAAIDPAGRVRRLATLEDSPEGTAGVAVGRDGTLYYGAHTETPLSDDEGLAALLHGLDASGRSELRAFDPRTGAERTLVGGLYRPVGVELSSGEDFVAVAEFFAYRVTRYWLKGPRAGSSDLLLDNLPGFPDGLASGGDGTFYVTLAALRTPALDWTHARPWLKNQLAKLLLLGLQPPSGGAGIVLAVDEAGRILESFHDPEGRQVSQVTTAEPYGGNLFLGSITGDWIARCPVDRLARLQ